MHTTYRPGQWYVIVLPGAVVAVPPDVPADVVARLWERMPDDRTLATVVDVLTSHVGGVVASLPPFVAAVTESAGLRIAVRGAVDARVITPTGSHDVTGADVTTWSERFVGDAARLEIALETVPGEDALPLRSGVVRAASVVAELDSEDEHPITAGAGEGEADEPSSEPEVAEESPDAPSEVTLAPSADDFDQLWGATVHSAPDVTAEPEAPTVTPDAPAVTPEAPAHGDHDGATISAAELRALRQQTAAADDVPTAAIPQTPAAIGRIRVSTGQVVALDRTVIIGRRPRSTRASGANLPHLIAVESPQQDISRSHLEIRPEGDTVVVIDLHTTNGSTLLRPDVDPMRLHPGEQTLVVSGDVVDLGDGVEVTFEDLP